MEVSFKVNGHAVKTQVEARTTLSLCLRDNLKLTGTHVGCEHGVCGACTVIVDGEAVRSCLTLAVQVEGRSITTVEGLADGDALSPLQAAFRRHNALQCGFCTPGMIMTTAALIKDHPQPTDEQIVHGLEGNLCRCTGYLNIVKAVKRAAELQGK